MNKEKVMPLLSGYSGTYYTRKKQRDADWEVYQGALSRSMDELIKDGVCLICGNLAEGNMVSVAEIEAAIYPQGEGLNLSHGLREDLAAAAKRVHDLQLQRPRLEREGLLDFLLGQLAEHPAWRYDIEGLADAILEEVPDA